MYARERISHVWLIDPRDRTVEVDRVSAGAYLLAPTWGGEKREARLEPFDAPPLAPQAFEEGKRRSSP